MNDEGRIFINGRETTAMEEDDLLALRRETMGMVFQDNSFFSGQTVYDNTAYRLDDRDWPEDEIERAVESTATERSMCLSMNEEGEKGKRRLKVAA
jgi:ABC-type proline/glycine betaine transport system ATPase subunit